MITGTERLLLQLYDPTSPKLQEPLQAPESASKAEVSPTYSQTNKTSQNALQEVVYKSSTGVTATMHVVMSANEYTDEFISKSCNAYNALNPKTMSHSYQLLHDFQGILKGSWVMVTNSEGKQ